MFHAELPGLDGDELAAGLERHIEGVLALPGIPAMVEAVVEPMTAPTTRHEHAVLPADWDIDAEDADTAHDPAPCLGGGDRLHFCGTPRLVAELDRGFSGRANDRDVRDRAIVARRGEGMSLEAIGVEFGLTRERVRQIVAENGGPGMSEVRGIRGAQAQAARDVLRGRCLEYLRERPGSTAGDLAEDLQVDAADVRAALGSDARRLLAPKPRLADRSSDDELLAELRLAAGLIGRPLTGAGFDRIERALGLHSRVLILQRFGTWVQACSLAGVTPGQAARDNYNRRWTADEMLAWVACYLAQPDSRGTYAGYDAFARSTAAAPSSQTVRNTIGPWAAIKAEALRRAAPGGHLVGATAA